MAALKKPKYEHFAQALAQGLNQTQAAVQAGFAETDAPSRGCKLARRPEIQARVKELEPRVAKQAEITLNITKAWMIEELQQVLAKAMETKQLGTAAKCIINIGKVSGVYVEKQEVDWLMTWDGNVQSISDERLKRVNELALKIACGDDQEKLAALKRRALGEPQVIDITPPKIMAASVVVQVEPGLPKSTLTVGALLVTVCHP